MPSTALSQVMLSDELVRQICGGILLNLQVVVIEYFSHVLEEFDVDTKPVYVTYR
jgi:hypothetical protein